MAKQRSSIVHMKKCVFCKYWIGTPAVPTKTKNYWEYDSDDKGECLQRRGTKATYTPACPQYEADNYKYPIIK